MTEASGKRCATEPWCAEDRAVGPYDAPPPRVGDRPVLDRREAVQGHGVEPRRLRGTAASRGSCRAQPIDAYSGSASGEAVERCVPGAPLAEPLQQLVHARPRVPAAPGVRVGGDAEDVSDRGRSPDRPGPPRSGTPASPPPVPPARSGCSGWSTTNAAKLPSGSASLVRRAGRDSPARLRWRHPGSWVDHHLSQAQHFLRVFDHGTAYEAHARHARRPCRERCPSDFLAVALAGVHSKVIALRS